MNGLILLLVLWTSVSSSLKADLRFSHFKNQDQEIQGLITAIKHDSIGFIWITTNTQILRFDGHEFKSIERIYEFPESFSPVKDINFFHITPTGEYWIGTQNNGAFRINRDTIQHYNTHAKQNKFKIATNSVHGIISVENGDTWLATNDELIEIKFEQNDEVPDTFNYPSDISKQIKNTLYTKDHKLLITNQSELLAFDINSRKFNVVDYDEPNEQSLIWEIFEDQDHNLWLSTAKGLYLKRPSQKWQPYMRDSLNEVIKSIQSKDGALWLGTAVNGLIKINLEDQSLTRYKNKKYEPDSLITDEVTRVLVDKNNILWVTHFDGRISFSDLTTLNFGLNLGLAQNECFTSKVIYDISQNNHNIWMANQNEIVMFDEDLENCHTFKLEVDSEVIPIQIYEDLQTIWIASTYGLHQLNVNNNEHDIKHFPFNHSLITFIEEYSSNELLVGTIQGLFLFDKNNGQFVKFNTSNTNCIDCRFMQATKNHDGHLLSTNKGLFWLIDGEVYQAEDLEKLLPTKNILNTSFDQENSLWVGTYKSGLYKIHGNNLVTSFNEKNGIPSQATIRSVIHINFNESWIATDNGLYRYESDKGNFQHFQVSDGLQGNLFNNGTAIQSSDGRVFFGGRFGYNAFYPGDIKINDNIPPVVLTEMTRFNKRLDVGKRNEAFTLHQDINLINKVVFTHEDYVMGFEFSALDYADLSRNKYAFKLEGFEPDWNYVGANNRTATYTNLPRGEYTFKVKASNSDGIWNEQGKSLKINVLPAPWLSWWAICLYVMTLISVGFWLINRKLQANQRLANLLRVEVQQKTEELQLQKQAVESLLAKKNELFSNVSHEFRTPLTLILGPMNELIAESQTSKSRQTLSILKRNANRLLSLVEQLLQLAKTSDFKQAKISEQETSQQVQAIIESFQHMAKYKKITLELKQNHQAYISATEQCLDATLGNLVSNAIKYSLVGGKVVVTSIQRHGELIIKVVDQGAGLTDRQKLEVFKRFERLDAHQDIDGIGIGLSVAKELVEINDGTIKVESELGEGSQFIISLPTIVKPSETIFEHYRPGTLINQLSKDMKNIPVPVYKNELVNNKNIVLVIEDNHDMRNYIISVLESEFHCLQAKNGKEGVANALKYVPDLIVCDIMMPKMNGFKVSRIIRSDHRTSHIPLILLTALNDRENRIKGWREHVDVYMTKPFDREELIIQVENIITIRNILKKKTHAIFKTDDSVIHSDLPKKDKAFIEKLFKVIKNNYQDLLLNRDKIAADMAVSDRQLQRKTKALIDQNPMDILREYRLKKAAEMLKDGYQVAQSSDEVGFKTPTHFSQCFKAQYGLTPKQYQQQFKSSKTDGRREV